MESSQSDEKFVTRGMLITDVLLKYPEVTPILMGYGLHCIGCSFSSYDTLEAGAKIHGMDEETIDMMLKDLNLIIKKFKDARGGEIDLNPEDAEKK